MANEIVTGDRDAQDEMLRDIARSLADDHTPREIAVYLPLTVEGVRDIVDADEDDEDGDQDEDEFDHFVVGGKGEGDEN